MATAFLGSRSLDGGGSFTVWTWLAILSFALIIGLAVYVLTPSTRWLFVNSPSRLLRDYVEADQPATLDDMHRDLALHVENDYDGNARGVKRLTTAVQGSCLLLLVEIALWLLDIRGRS